MSGTFDRPRVLHLARPQSRTPPETISQQSLSALRPATVEEALRVWEAPLLRIAVAGVATMDQQDLVQDINTALCKAWADKVLPSDCPFAYTLKIAVNCRNQFLKAAARQRRRRRWLETIGFLQVAKPQSQKLEQQACDRDALSLALTQGLGGLPKRQREAFSLVCVQEVSFHDASVILGVHQNTVRERVKLARKHLAHFLTYNT